MGGEHEITKVHVIFNLFSFSHYQYRLSGLCCYVARCTKKRMVGINIIRIDEKDNEGL